MNKDMLISKFKTIKKNKQDFKKNQSKVFHHRNTQIALKEARRAIAFANKEFVLKNRQSYIDWMINALDFFLEAKACKDESLKLSWKE